MKKFLNDPDTLLREALGGMALAHADLLVAQFEPTFVRRAVRPAAVWSPWRTWWTNCRRP